MGAWIGIISAVVGVLVGSIAWSIASSGGVFRDIAHELRLIRITLQEMRKDRDNR